MMFTPNLLDKYVELDNLLTELPRPPQYQIRCSFNAALFHFLLDQIVDRL